MKNSMLKQSLFLCAVFFGGALIAGTVTNADILQQRFGVVVCYNYYNNQINLKKNSTAKNAELKEPLQTRLCKYNPTGDIFVHLHDTGDNFGTVLKIYTIDNNIITSWKSSPNHLSDCILSSGQHSDYVFMNKKIVTGNDYTSANWVTLYEIYPFISYNIEKNNVIKMVSFSPTGNSFLCAREGSTFCYNKETEDEYTWSRDGGKHVTFLNEKYMVAVPEKNSKVSVFSIEENPQESFLPQGDDYVPEQVILSHDGKIVAIASSYEHENRLFTQIILYDAQTLQEKNKLYVPGILFSGKRIEQHESIYFSLNDKNLFLHTLTQHDGINSWYIDITSNNNFLRIKHTKDIKKVYELCGQYHFGGIKDKKVSIFDMRNQNRTIDVKVEDATHLALNPTINSKIKAMIAVKNSIELLQYTGS